MKRLFPLVALAFSLLLQTASAQAPAVKSAQGAGPQKKAPAPPPLTAKPEELAQIKAKTAQIVALVQELKALSRPCEKQAELAQVATISANGDTEIGAIIAECMAKVGKEGVITVEEAKKAKEAFITSATSFVTPVVRIDGDKVGDGKVGATARRLREEYVRFSEAGEAVT